MDTTFGDFLRRRREELRLTLAQVGERAGMSPQHVHNYESGKNALPPPDVTPRLAAALEVTEEELLRAVGYLRGVSESGDPPPHLVVQAMERIEKLATEEARLAAFRQLPQAIRRSIRRLVGDFVAAATEELTESNGSQSGQTP